MTIQQLAERITNPPNEKGEREVFIDPVTIMLICSILSAIFNGIRAWRTWRNSKESAVKVIDKCSNNNLIVRRFINRAVKANKPGIGRKELVETTVNIMSNISKLTPEELVKLVDEN